MKLALVVLALVACAPAGYQWKPGFGIEAIDPGDRLGVQWGAGGDRFVNVDDIQYGAFAYMELVPDLRVDKAQHAQEMELKHQLIDAQEQLVVETKRANDLHLVIHGFEESKDESGVTVVDKAVDAVVTIAGLPEYVFWGLFAIAAILAIGVIVLLALGKRIPFISKGGNGG